MLQPPQLFVTQVLPSIRHIQKHFNSSINHGPRAFEAAQRLKNDANSNKTYHLRLVRRRFHPSRVSSLCLRQDSKVSNSPVAALRFVHNMDEQQVIPKPEESVSRDNDW